MSVANPFTAQHGGAYSLSVISLRELLETGRKSNNATLHAFAAGNSIPSAYLLYLLGYNKTQVYLLVYVLYNLCSSFSLHEKSVTYDSILLIPIFHYMSLLFDVLL